MTTEALKHKFVQLCIDAEKHADASSDVFEGVKAIAALRYADDIAAELYEDYCVMVWCDKVTKRAAAVWSKLSLKFRLVDTFL